MHVILASQSTRRYELLTAMGVVFEVVPSNYQEQLDDTRSPEAVAIELALGKAKEVAERFPDALVIGSDTIVVDPEGKQLGKARSVEEERRLLRSLCGQVTEVITSISIICINRRIEYATTDKTEVRFKPFAEVKEAFETYIASDDWRDKAVYGIQSGAAPLVASIHGNYDTILGLPTQVLAPMLTGYGIEASPASLVPPVPIRL